MTEREYVITQLKYNRNRTIPLYTVLNFKDEEIFIFYLLGILKPLGLGKQFLENYYLSGYSSEEMIRWLLLKGVMTAEEFRSASITADTAEELQEFVDYISNI